MIGRRVSYFKHSTSHNDQDNDRPAVADLFVPY